MDTSAIRKIRILIDSVVF